MAAERQEERPPKPHAGSAGSCGSAGLEGSRLARIEANRTGAGGERLFTKISSTHDAGTNVYRHQRLSPSARQQASHATRTPKRATEEGLQRRPLGTDLLQKMWRGRKRARKLKASRRPRAGPARSRKPEGGRGRDWPALRSTAH